MREYDEATLKKLHRLELEILKDFISVCQKHHLEYFGIAGTAIGVLRHGGFIPWDDDLDIALSREDYETFLKVADQELSDRYIIMNARNYPEWPSMVTRLILKGTRFREACYADVKVPLGIFIDIYPYDHLSDDPKKRKKQMWDAWFYSKLQILRGVKKPVLQFKGWKADVVHAACFVAHYGMKALRISPQWLEKKCEEASQRHNDETGSEYVDFLCDTTKGMNMYKQSDLYPLQKMQFEDIEMFFPHSMDANLTNMYGDYMTLPPEEKRKNHFPFELQFPGESVIKQ